MQPVTIRGAPAKGRCFDVEAGGMKFEDPAWDDPSMWNLRPWVYTGKPAPLWKALYLNGWRTKKNLFFMNWGQMKDTLVAEMARVRLGNEADLQKLNWWALGSKAGYGGRVNIPGGVVWEDSPKCARDGDKVRIVYAASRPLKTMDNGPEDTAEDAKLHTYHLTDEGFKAAWYLQGKCMPRPQGKEVARWQIANRDWAGTCDLDADNANNANAVTS